MKYLELFVIASELGNSRVAHPQIEYKCFRAACKDVTAVKSDFEMPVELQKNPP